MLREATFDDFVEPVILVAVQEAKATDSLATVANLPCGIDGGFAVVDVVIEVKRELLDSSFDALAASYQAQATDYQNVSVRLGFLLVLDLSNKTDEGTPHIRSLVQTRSVQRPGEDYPRLLVIVKVPGNRKRPSDLTNAAKKNNKR